MHTGERVLLVDLHLLPKVLKRIQLHPEWSKHTVAVLALKSKSDPSMCEGSGLRHGHLQVQKGFRVARSFRMPSSQTHLFPMQGETTHGIVGELDFVTNMLRFPFS